MRLLIANRGEVVVRVARAAAALDIPCSGIASVDDAGAPHTRAVESLEPLPGHGPAAYLDIEQVVAAAVRAQATHVHPGWGFLSESAAFADACAAGGLAFVGPRADTLALLGDKISARGIARAHGIPVLEGSEAPVNVAEAEDFMAHVGGPILLKALAGGGGRGIRVVRSPDELADAYRRCRAEAENATGRADVYVERMLENARHVEVQVLGDGSGEVVVLGDRDCSIQLRHQKVIEFGPAAARALQDAARVLASGIAYRSLGTFEFLVSGDEWAFIEANPRLQVEHPVTELVTGLDLVELQLGLERGEPLPDEPVQRGVAIQLRVNAEEGGTITTLTLPSDCRVDTAAEPGSDVNPAYDALIGKLLVRGDNLEHAADAALRGLADLHLEGVPTNTALLRTVLEHPDFRAGHITTTWLQERGQSPIFQAPVKNRGLSPIFHAAQTGTVIEIVKREGDEVPAGGAVLVLEAMKMHHEIAAPAAGIVRDLTVKVGEHVRTGDPLFRIDAQDVAHLAADPGTEADLDHVRPDLATVLERRGKLLDANRPQAVEKRRKLNRRTARENVEDLVDDGTFSEYGGLTLAAQRARRSEQDLIDNTPGDGMVCGTGEIGGQRAAVLTYDYTVMAGTQGQRNHRKTDRLLELARDHELPIVLFAEGGGGRPGDTERSELFDLVVPTFYRYAALSGLVPRIGIVSGRCFAGNAALLGCSDVIIATPEASIGMGGPAMIEGGGLGRFDPDEVGPVSMLEPNGVIDLVASDEAEAVDLAKRLISLLTMPQIDDHDHADQRELRTLIPEDPKRTHDARKVLDTFVDTGSSIELRPNFGHGIITTLARVEGRAVGILANDPSHLSGAIDATGSDKAARFLQLCDAFGLPIVSLVDTPGFMVGPDSEAEAMVRRCSRLFMAAATCSVPWVCVVVRRAFGLGAQAMAGGGFHVPVLNIAWPTGEFGAMGVEGAVRLALRKELDAIEDPQEREQRVKDLVKEVRANSGALNMAAVFEIDDVIDPVDTRARVISALNAAPVKRRRRTMIDAW